ncbi:MAG: helix-turn-helix domain-containing protein [Deltaproteobacteria bacterium]|nr:MAG: helix-turn-helix domain-containing protein [Deltaproteobacteria bacterium]
MPSPSLPTTSREPSPAPSFGERRAGSVTTAPETVQRWIEEHGWSGALIRAVREARGLSLRDVGDATKISARYLEAIEADDFGQLPSSTFVKGYLREIARLLDLAESELIAGYLRRIT